LIVSADQRIELTIGDITQLDVDAIVNAANRRMLGGGGVDGAIHRAAGAELKKACLAVPEVAPGVRCPTGEARITQGFNLAARYIIHTVGPVFSGGGRGEDKLLNACYINVLKLAEENNIRSIAFPCISTGVYRFPRQVAAKIAIAAVRDWLSAHNLPETVIFRCFSEEDAQYYRSQL